MIGAFDLVEPVASGGAGTVWSAWHRPTGQRVAVKVLAAEVAHDELFVRSFRNEVRATARLDHPHVIRVLDHGRVTRDQAALEPRLPAAAPWLAMDWVDGGHLRPDLVDDWEDLADVALALLSALAHAHARGVLHRDLKPGNVLLAGADDAVPGPRLSDFAISARRTQGPSTVPRMGTPEYLPPERLRDAWWEEGPASDLYALGLVLWRMLAHDWPHGGDELEAVVQARLQGRFLPLRPRFAVPDGAEAWLCHLLAASPTARPRSAAAAGRELLALGSPPEPRRRRRTPWELRLLAAPRHGGLPRGWEVEAGPPRARLAADRLDLRPVPTIDRVVERDRLWSRLLRVHETRSPRLVLLEGPSGFGKSHLATWLAEAAEELGVAEVLQASHDASAGPQHGLGPMFARWLRVLGMPHDRALPAIEARLAQHGIDVTDAALSIAELVRDEDVDAVGLRFQHPLERHALMRSVLAGLGEHGVVVLVLDDLQWGSEACVLARALLDAPRDQALPVLVIGTWATDREGGASEQLQALAEHPSARRIEVGPLAPEDLRHLVREHLGLDPQLAVRVEERASGNPSYVLKLVETWGQRGLLVSGSTGWRLAEGATVSLPRSVRAAWLGRVEPLLAGWPSTAGEALELAAVLGQHVAVAEWEGVCRSLGIPPPRRLVEQLADAGLVHVHAADTWSFAHAMLRDALVERAEEGARLVRHHQACARVLLHSAQRGHEARLGRHLLAGGDPVAALAPLADAVEHTMDLGEYALAEVLLRDRDAAMSQAALAEDDPRWGRGWLLWCRLLRGAGRERQVEELAERTVAAGRRHAWGAELVRGLIYLGRAALRRGRPELAWQHLGDAEAVLERLDDPLLAAEVYRSQGFVLTRQGRLAEAATSIQRALALLATRQDPLRRAGTLLDLAYVARQAGEAASAAAHAEEALGLYRRAGSRWGVANAMNLLGEVARQRGEHAVAAGHYRQAARRAAAVGASLALPPRINLGLCLVEGGQAGEARQQLLGVLAEVSSTQRPDLVATAYAGLAAAAAALGDWQAVVHDLAMIEQQLTTGEYVDRDLSTMLERTGRLALDAGRLPEARAALCLAAEQWRALGEAEAVVRVEAWLGGEAAGAEE